MKNPRKPASLLDLTQETHLGAIEEALRFCCLHDAPVDEKVQSSLEALRTCAAWFPVPEETLHDPQHPDMEESRALALKKCPELALLVLTADELCTIVASEETLLTGWIASSHPKAHSFAVVLGYHDLPETQKSRYPVEKKPYPLLLNPEQQREFVEVYTAVNNPNYPTPLWEKLRCFYISLEDYFETQENS